MWLALADRAQQVQNAAREIFLRGFHLQAALRVKRRQVIEEDLVARDFGVFKIDRFDLDEREVTLTVFRRTHLA